jgi:nucleotide-binding universal stress UspA family protein
VARSDTVGSVTALIAYDGSEPAAEAIRAAAALLPGSPAVIAHVRGNALTPGHAGAARAALPDHVIAKAVHEYEAAAGTAAQQVAHRGAAIARDAGLEATTAVVTSGTPWRGLVAAAEEHGAAVIVCGTRGEGGFSRAVLGSTSSSLLHNAPLPVLVVPADAGALTGPAVIGYDGSDGARDAVGLAAKLLAGRPAVVVHGWASPVRRSAWGASLMGGPLDEFQQIATDLDGMFTGEAEELAEEGARLARDQGLDARALAVESAPGAWRALTAAARTEEAAVVVTGSRGRGAVASTLLGSVSSGLVHNAEVPVLVARAA